MHTNPYFCELYDTSSVNHEMPPIFQKRRIIHSTHFYALILFIKVYEGAHRTLRTSPKLMSIQMEHHVHFSRGPARGYVTHQMDRAKKLKCKLLGLPLNKHYCLLETQEDWHRIFDFSVCTTSPLEINMNVNSYSNSA